MDRTYEISSIPAEKEDGPDPSDILTNDGGGMLTWLPVLTSSPESEKQKHMSQQTLAITPKHLSWQEHTSEVLLELLKINNTHEFPSAIPPPISIPIMHQPCLSLRSLLGPNKPGI
jgi:hypothetical protein